MSLLRHDTLGETQRTKAISRTLATNWYAARRSSHNKTDDGKATSITRPPSLYILSLVNNRRASSSAPGHRWPRLSDFPKTRWTPTGGALLPPAAGSTKSSRACRSVCQTGKVLRGCRSCYGGGGGVLSRLFTYLAIWCRCGEIVCRTSSKQILSEDGFSGWMASWDGWLPWMADSTPTHVHARARTRRSSSIKSLTLLRSIHSPTPIVRAKHPYSMLVHVSCRSKKNSKRTDAAAAIAIQRWQRQLVQARVKSARAHQEVGRRRWAVDKLHAAYAKRWRFGVAARRDRRRKFEEEEEVRSGGSVFGIFCVRYLLVGLDWERERSTTLHV